MKKAIPLCCLLACCLILLAGCAGQKELALSSAKGASKKEASKMEKPALPEEAPEAELDESPVDAGAGAAAGIEAAASEDIAAAPTAAAPSGAGEAGTESKAAKPMPSEALKEKALQPEAASGPAAAPKEAAPPVVPDTAAAQEGAQRREEKGTTRYLSADDSNSAASPTIARRLILNGRYVQPAVIRTYEFLNYYNFDYPAPTQRPVSIIPQMRPAESEGEYSLQIAVRSRDRSLAEIQPLNLTFLLDVSGSMAGSPIELAKKLLKAMAGKLRPGDLVSLVTCSRDAQVLLEGHAVSSGTAALMDKLLAGVRPDDVTNLGKGVQKAYQVANKTYNYRFLNRVVVISDGADNVSPEAEATIAKYAEDSDRQGIYLAGIGVGEGFNDQLMNRFTDKGRGAYLFVDSAEEIQRLMSDRSFVAAFDLAVKNVRLKMVMPPGWEMVAFHGEQVSERAADIVPQYLSSSDQMIYNLVLKSPARQDALEQAFQFEVEYTPLPGRPETLGISATAQQMLSRQQEIFKGDVVVEYAELLKKIQAPLEEHRRENLEEFDKAVARISEARRSLRDPELSAILDLLSKYRKTVELGERFAGSRDGQSDAPDAVLGISPNTLRKLTVKGRNSALAVKALQRLGGSTRLAPLEGYKFLGLSSGPVGNPSPAGTGELAGYTSRDPMPDYMGRQKIQRSAQEVFDLHQVVFDLKAPAEAKSFSFDFNFFSAEYPEYINQNFNDTFYAILEAKSTNAGLPTNIAFDANNNSIEVDNNYFQQPFHPIPNTGTGFDQHGSTGWLRTSWPIRGGEEFRLTFSIHDEGDAIFDSLVIMDNFQWHEYDSVGTTDPLN